MVKVSESLELHSQKDLATTYLHYKLHNLLDKPLLVGSWVVIFIRILFQSSKPLANQRSAYRHFIVTSLSIIDTLYNASTNAHSRLKHNGY